MQKKKKYWTGIIGIIWVAGLLIAQAGIIVTLSKLL
jgi:hypothetical protein